MNLVDTLAHADNYGWQHTTSDSSIETHAGRIDGLTRLELSNRTHLIFAWFGPGYFHSAQLFHAGEFEPYLSCTDDGHLTAWIQCHADTGKAFWADVQAGAEAVSAVRLSDLEAAS